MLSDQMELGTYLRSDPYLRERLHPKPGDATYLHLADLRLAIETVRTEAKIKLLDYGCGGSPYRSLFPNADYNRADYLQSETDKLEYILTEDSCVTEKDGTFDFVLSTQVLEHVTNPAFYLRECIRLLKNRGCLYITTHGTYPDHGCPYDFYRWTADGLVRDLKAVGFEILRTEKHTTGPRAFFFNCDCQCDGLQIYRRTLFSLGLRAFRTTYRRFQPWLHRMCDSHFPNNRIVTQNLERHSLYIVAGCLAQKP
jgi:SAM-dependent methyltransferase